MRSSLHRRKLTGRRTVPFIGLAGILILLLLLAGCGAASSAGTNSTEPSSGQAFAAASTKSVVKIGYQKGGSLPLLKAQGTLEKRLVAQGITVEWTEFPAGPPLLEALNAGSIDIGSTGQAPPVFAQAAGTELVYVASLLASTHGQAILVPKDSPIKSVAELKGKKVAFAKGSSAHFFIIKALEQAGLKYEDIQPAFLTPPDARPAFDGGTVDAWVIWEPYLTVALRATNARVINDGTGLPAARSYYLASRPFVHDHPDLVKALLEEVDKVEKWSAAHRQEAAQALAPIVGIDEATMQEVVRKQTYGLEPITDTIVAEQQQVADTFFNLNLTPKRIVIKNVIWQWGD